MSDLCTLIEYLEYGTKLHISIDFVGDRHNSHCALPTEHTIHCGAICDHFKKEPESFKQCRRCSMTVLKRAARAHHDSAGLCINGVFEYTRPIRLDGKPVCVLRIGNILTPAGEARLRDRTEDTPLPLDTMEKDYTLDRCREMADLIEDYIGHLLEKYPEEPTGESPLIRNIRQYIRANAPYDITVASVARLFSYNEAYLGRLFHRETGCSLREYINRERIRIAKRLLQTDSPVTAVAQLSGYNSIAYFNRVFKAYTGQTPSAYRAAQK